MFLLLLLPPTQPPVRINLRGSDMLPLCPKDIQVARDNPEWTTSIENVTWYCPIVTCL